MAAVTHYFQRTGLDTGTFIKGLLHRHVCTVLMIRAFRISVRGFTPQAILLISLVLFGEASINKKMEER
jgi:hypothetical protein